MRRVQIIKVSELYIRVICHEDKGLSFDFYDHFSFFIDGYQFMPSYKKGFFDGKLKLYDFKTGLLFKGLLPDVMRICKKRDIPMEIDPGLRLLDHSDSVELFREVEHQLEPRDYQWDSFRDAVRYNSATILSPTGCMDENTEIEVELSEEIIKITLSELERLVSAGYTPKISTPSGYEKITDTYRKNGPGLLFTFDDSSRIRCSDVHLFWDEGWKTANQFHENQILGNKKIISVVKVPIQDWIDFTVDANHSSYYHNGILHHNSGKSLIIFLLTAYFRSVHDLPVLIVVPSIGLVQQLFGDFETYQKDICLTADCHLVHSGADPLTTQPIVISTWQSLFKKPADYFQRFGVYICDECHLADAKSLSGISEKLSHVPYRYGFTGTLDGTKVHEFQIRGCFGPLIKHVTTQDLIEQKVLSEIRVECVLLKHPPQQFLDYHEEIHYITRCPARNRFLLDLITSINKNTLILFNFIEHGDFLFEELLKRGQKVFLINAKTDAGQRERIRSYCEKHTDVKIVASYGVFSQGVNIRNLHYLILAHPYKGRIRNLQSIGRAIRTHQSKERAIVFDIADQFGRNKTYAHFLVRKQMYESEGFPYRITEKDLKNGSIVLPSES